MIARIAILGTGLLGSSTALAMRASGFQGAILGWDRFEQESKTALDLGILDEVALDPVEAAKASDVVLLAAPVHGILDWMERLAPELGEHQLVTDVGSTKALITESAQKLFNQPHRAAFLPGHPMAGKELGGPRYADATIFEGSAWIFTGQPDNSPLAAEWIELVSRFGSRVLHMDAARHDEMVAWVSHLPQYLSTALSALLEDEVGKAPELNAIGGRALREMTRLGSSPYSMWRDIAMTNTEPIAKAIHALEQRLAYLRENLRTPELKAEFEQANRFRKSKT